MFNSSLKMRDTFLLVLSVVINGLKCIEEDIRPDICATER